MHGGSLDVPFDLLAGVIVNVDLEGGRGTEMQEVRQEVSWCDTLYAEFTSFGDSTLMNCS